MGRKGRVFVVGAHIPNGGTYMAYQLGRIVCERWDYVLVPVEVDPKEEAHSVWTYERHEPKMTLEETSRQAGRGDVLICNPSYSSHMPGLSFPGRKLMYIQGVNTFEILDGFFDKYVASSTFVRDFIFRTYGMTVPIIAPFVHHDHLPNPLPAWEDRPERSVVVGLKSHGGRFLDHFCSILERERPGLKFSKTIPPGNVPHRDFLKTISEHRYFLWLSALEGFGLPPLEAMTCGTAVAGFHACGGDFFRHGENSLVCGYPDFRRLAALLAELLSDESLAAALSGEGRRTAAGYTFERFKNAWIEELGPFLD